MRARKYAEADLPAMIPIWNEIVEEGAAFPQEELLTMETGRAFFAAQSHTAVIEDETGRILGLYILHPNNVGRCAHICNASYAVSSASRGKHIGEKLVLDCIREAQYPCPAPLRAHRLPAARHHPRGIPDEGWPLRKYLPLLHMPG